MASIWIARLTGKHGFEKLFAVKTILPQYATDLRFQQMFLDEARIASAIDHANVAHIIDLGEEGDVLYLVMEWIEGDSLSKLNRAVQKRGKRLPVGVVLRVLADICGGLHAAHEMRSQEGHLLGVVHRDVSPQNILISTKGIAKLIDFGVAKARDRVAGETSAGQLKGKIHYMAPEQALGRTVDRRADVWSIGAVGYHLLAGIPPFDGANELATLHMLTSGKQPAPLPDHVPIAVADPIFRALVDNPEERIRTALEMQRALEQSMFDAGVMTTTADVAELCAQYLADRIESRRRSVQKALQAATERGQTMPPRRVKPSVGDSSSGIDHPVSQIKEAGSVSSSLHMPYPGAPASTVPGLGPHGSDAPSGPSSGSRSGLSVSGAPGSYSGSSLGGLSSPGSSSASGTGMPPSGGMAAYRELNVEGSANGESSSLGSAGSELQWPPPFAATSWRRWALWGAAAGLGVFALILVASLAWKHNPEPPARAVVVQPAPTAAAPADNPVANVAGSVVEPSASASGSRSGTQSVAGSLPPIPPQVQRPTAPARPQGSPSRNIAPKSPPPPSTPSPKKPAGNDYGF